MTRKRLISLLAALSVVAVIGIGAAVALDDPTSTAVTEEAEDADDGREDSAEGPDVAITGTDLERASTAALEYVGEGRVTATEVGDEESYYEVEVTLDDGRQVDVQLDEEFDVVGTD